MPLTINTDSVISGKKADCYIYITDKNGNRLRYNFAQASKVELKVDIEKTEFNALNCNGKLHRQNGWKGTGSATFRYNTSVFRKILKEYDDTSILAYFDMQIRNLDPQSERKLGYQEVWARDCCLDSLILAKFDVDSEVLDEDISFTFDKFSLGNEFNIAPEMKG